MLRCELKAVAATAREIWLTYGCCARTGRVLCRMWCQCLARQWKGTPRAARSEADARPAGPAGPGRASIRRAERSSRRGRRAGGQVSRRSQIWRGFGRPQIWRGSGGGRRSGGAAAAVADLAGLWQAADLAGLRSTLENKREVGHGYEKPATCRPPAFCASWGT